MTRKASDLKRQVLLAALECGGGDLTKTFTFEELLVRAWRQDPPSWGLRGFEREHPDSERIHRELDSRGKNAAGLIAQGLLEKVRVRVYRLTPKGLASASQLRPDDSSLRERVSRHLEDEVRRILGHRTFRDWLKDSTYPKRFPEAGHFWGIAPGTSPGVVRARVEGAEQILKAALEFLDSRGLVQAEEGRGRVLFERTDIERCREFLSTLRKRFSAELRMLGLPQSA